MDQQMKLRPRKNPAQKKTGNPTHSMTRTCNPASHAGYHKSPPNFNQQALASPALLAITLDDCNNEREMPTSSSAPDGAAAGPPQVNDANTPDTRLLPTNLETFFRKATEKCEHIIWEAVDSFISKLNDLKVSMEASLEF